MLPDKLLYPKSNDFNFVNLVSFGSSPKKEFFLKPIISNCPKFQIPSGIFPDKLLLLSNNSFNSFKCPTLWGIFPSN